MLFTTSAARLRDEDAALVAFFEALAPEQWRTPIYTESTPWTSHDVWRTWSARSGA